MNVFTHYMFRPFSWLDCEAHRFEQAVDRRPPRYASDQLQVDNIFVFIRQVASVPACWLLRQQQQVDL